MPAPVSHITGLLMAVTLPLVSGCSVLLGERWDAARAVDDMRHYGVTYSGGATVFIQELADAVDAAGLDALPLACGYNLGGSAIPFDVVERCEALGFRPRARVRDDRVPDGLGVASATTAPRCAASPTAASCPGSRCGWSTPTGATSAAVPRASSSCGGRSARSATSTRSTPRDGFDADGWFRSGDLGFVDDRNCITVTGRTKDVINRGGEKLSAQEIEGLLRRHPDVTDAAVVAAPHPRLGEEPAAFVIAATAPRSTTPSWRSSSRPRASPRRRSPASW